MPEISDELLGDVWQGFAKSIRQLRAKAVTDRYIYRSDLYGDLARKHKIDEDTAHAVMTELVARGKCELRDEGRQTRVFVRGDVFAPFDPTPTPRHQPVTPATGVNETGTPGPEPENEVVEADGMPEPEKEIARENLGDEADKGWNDLSPVEKRARLLEETGESIADAALRQRLGIGIRKLATIDPNTREWAGLMGFWDELFERATGMDAEKALASLLTTSQPEVEHALPF